MLLLYWFDDKVILRNCLLRFVFENFTKNAVLYQKNHETKSDEVLKVIHNIVATTKCEATTTVKRWVILQNIFVSLNVVEKMMPLDDVAYLKITHLNT